MIAALSRALSSEWLKRRRSMTTWLVLGSAAFVPSLIFVSRFRRIDSLPALHRDPRFWDLLWGQVWESMSLMILPLAVMMMVSLITQIEDRNNAWKQVHAAPLPLPAIYTAKLLVILFLVFQLVMLFTGGIYLIGLLPAIVIPGIDRPSQPFPFLHSFTRAAQFFVDALPIVAVQYLLALRFRTFVAPLAIGMALWILSVGTVSWKYNFVIPYSYAGLDYLIVEYHRRITVQVPASPPVIAGTVFLVFTLAGYAVFASRRDKG